MPLEVSRVKPGKAGRLHDPMRSGLPVNSRQREVWQVRAPAASSVVARRCCQWEVAPPLLMAAWLVQISTGVIGVCSPGELE